MDLGTSKKKTVEYSIAKELRREQWTPGLASRTLEAATRCVSQSNSHLSSFEVVSTV